MRVHDKAAAQADVDVQAAVERVAEALGDTGRILVRESGTEPLLRVMVEAVRSFAENMWTRWLRSSVRRGMWQSDVLDADRRCLKNGAVRRI